MAMHCFVFVKNMGNEKIFNKFLKDIVSQTKEWKQLIKFKKIIPLKNNEKPEEKWWCTKEFGYNLEITGKDTFYFLVPWQCPCWLFVNLKNEIKKRWKWLHLKIYFEFEEEGPVWKIFVNEKRAIIVRTK